MCSEGRPGTEDELHTSSDLVTLVTFVQGSAQFLNTSLPYIYALLDHASLYVHV